MNHVWGLFSHPDREMHVIRNENETVAHHYTHHVLLMAAVPLTGWIGSSATGIDTVFFGRWIVPPIAPVSERLDDIFMGLHWTLTKLLVLCVILHIAGALDRHFRKGDATLRRMWRG